MKVKCKDCGISGINFPNNNICGNCNSDNIEDYKKQIEEDSKEYRNLVKAGI